jgi:hypothetical protein
MCNSRKCFGKGRLHITGSMTGREETPTRHGYRSARALLRNWSGRPRRKHQPHARTLAPIAGGVLALLVHDEAFRPELVPARVDLRIEPELDVWLRQRVVRDGAGQAGQALERIGLLVDFDALGGACPG